MGLRLGDDAPNFTAETTEGTIDFYDWKGDSWAVLFSVPRSQNRAAIATAPRSSANSPATKACDLFSIGESYNNRVLSPSLKPARNG